MPSKVGGLKVAVFRPQQHTVPKVLAQFAPGGVGGEGAAQGARVDQQLRRNIVTDSTSPNQTSSKARQDRTGQVLIRPSCSNK